MKKSNVKVSSTRRAIDPERMFPIVQCTQYKRQMKMILMYQGLESTSYQVKKQRYTHSQTALPVFQGEDRTADQICFGQNTVTSPSLSMLSESSFEDFYERMLKQYSSKLLTEAPQSPLEWMYATGGIIL